jgi:hypothetical protein
VCAHVFDIGLQPGYQGGEPRHQRVYFIGIDSSDGNAGGDSEVDYKTLRLSDSLHSKSRLSGLVKALRGGLTDEEMQRNEFDPATLVGAPCTIQVEHAKRDDGTTFAKIAAVLPHDKRNSVLKPSFDQKFDIPDWARQLRDDALSAE